MWGLAIQKACFFNVTRGAHQERMANYRNLMLVQLERVSGNWDLSVGLKLFGSASAPQDLLQQCLSAGGCC